MATQPKIHFTPVPVRPRHDGWTPERQSLFLEALAQCGCVDEACARVGMGRSSAYELRARMDADSFRAGWSAALDQGVGRLEDSAFSRAINGVTRPVFYKGEQIGERTYYDERLAMFLLRYRDPARYGRRDASCPARKGGHGNESRDVDHLSPSGRVSAGSPRLFALPRDCSAIPHLCSAGRACSPIVLHEQIGYDLFHRRGSAAVD